MRYQYNFDVNSDPNDPNGYCSHRMCRICRVCGKRRFLDCVCGKSLGFWESSPIRWKSGPELLPYDGKKIPRQRKVKRPQETPTKDTDPDELPPVILNTSFRNYIVSIIVLLQILLKIIMKILGTTIIDTRMKHISWHEIKKLRRTSLVDSLRYSPRKTSINKLKVQRIFLWKFVFFLLWVSQMF